MDPHKEPARPTVHWDYMLKEMRWMAVDFAEVHNMLSLPYCLHAVLSSVLHWRMLQFDIVGSTARVTN